MIGEDGELLKAVSTWNFVIFRIYFYSPAVFQFGSVVLKISTLTGVVLALMSTQPDQKILTPFKEGLNFIDCRIDKLPLSAGQYNIGAALAIPNVEWLCNELDFGVLTVQARDIYNSGKSPDTTRYQVAMDVSWAQPNVVSVI